MTLTRKVDGVEVPISAAEERAIRAEWTANETRITNRLVPLPAWAFWEVVENTPGLLTRINAAIDGLPDGTAKRQARGKFKRQTTFRPDAPEIVSLRALILAADPTFDFEALWREGMALL